MEAGGHILTEGLDPDLDPGLDPDLESGLDPGFDDPDFESAGESGFAQFSDKRAPQAVKFTMPLRAFLCYTKMVVLRRDLYDKNRSST